MVGLLLALLGLAGGHWTVAGEADKAFPTPYLCQSDTAEPQRNDSEDATEEEEEPDCD